MQEANSFDRETLKKIGKSFLIVISGTALTFLADNLTQITTGFSLKPEVQVILSGILMLVINASREYLKGVDLPARK
jgi:hypothetical protein